MDTAPGGQRLSWRTRLLDRLASPALKLPPRTTAVRRLQTDVPTRDGEQLKTDVYLPAAGEVKATVLIRSPYGRGFPMDVSLGRPLAARGYQVVVQSVRGRSGSTGTFDPMVNEAADGIDTVAWLREQSWFTGRLAVVGGSYLGFAAWALLTDPPEELKAAVIVVGPHDFAKGIYGSGAFALGDFFGWSEAMTFPEGESAFRQARRLSAARRAGAPDLTGLPLPSAGATLLEGRAPWFAAWAARDDIDDAFWAPYRLGSALERSEVPTLLIGGWYDAILEQTLEQYEALRRRDVPVGLTIGPWRHMDTVTKAAADVTREALSWLEGRFTSTTAHIPKVRTFLTGADEWREDWPAPTVDVELGVAHGKLGEADDGVSSFTFDPADPTPSVGGRLLAPMGAGVQDNRGLLERADVVTFAGEPLPHDWEICGRPELTLSISVSNPHADVFVRLCEVDVKGVASNVADGFLRLDPTVKADRVQQLSLALDPCYHRVKAGNRLMLLVAGGAHPRFARNLGTGEPAATGTTLSPQPHTVHHVGTILRLPLVKTD